MPRTTMLQQALQCSLDELSANWSIRFHGCIFDTSKHAQYVKLISSICSMYRRLYHHPTFYEVHIVRRVPRQDYRRPAADVPCGFLSLYDFFVSRTCLSPSSLLPLCGFPASRSCHVPRGLPVTFSWLPSSRSLIGGKGVIARSLVDGLFSTAVFNAMRFFQGVANANRYPVSTEAIP